MKEGKNTFEHELSTRKRKNRLLKILGNTRIVCTYKLTNVDIENI